MNSPEAKSFILFKKKLYSAYEVYNWSSIEHDEFSTHIGQDHIYHMVESNNRHLAEIRNINRFEWLQN